MTVSTRPLCLSDVPRVLALQSQCYEAQFLESAQAFEAKLAAGERHRCSWIAERGDEALAYVVALPTCAQSLPALDAPRVLPSAQPDLLYLHDLAVAPAGRSLGLARRLVGLVEQAAAALSLERIGLIAVQGSQAFWQRQGFEARASLPAGKLASFGAGACWMERRLRPAPTTHPGPRS